MSNIRVDYEELFEVGTKALELVGVPQADARTAVEMLLYADLRGVGTHGIQRLLMYVPRLRTKLINPSPDIVVDALSPVMRLVDGDNGLGPVVAARGMQEAIAVAKESGMAFVGCKNSNHFGAAAPYAQMACDERMIALVTTNAVPTMAPWGGLKEMVGNNPFAFGCPSEGDVPFILDIALSVSSRGRIREMANGNERIPEGWALDSNGTPTTDPMEALKGFVLPIGGHKGYGIALAIDVISGVLTGAGFSDGVRSMLQQSEEPQHIGHSMFVIDPTRFMPWEVFSDRMRALRDSVRSVPLMDPSQPVLIPGELEAGAEKKRREEGIPIRESNFLLLEGLARGEYEYEGAKV
ncbi:MAG: Ldh family oxidoreductase [Gemmatimonadota bacterium]|jgi:ureidoglycolate dehydrogenase (NAD+)